MTLASLDSSMFKRLTCGNESAAEFLTLWRSYVHDIDDLVDGDKTGAEFLLRTFLSAAFIYTHPFFLANLPALRQVIINCTNAYADTAAWEKAPDWRREFSDHYRHFGVEMVLAVAFICGGYDHMRQASPLLRSLCQAEHGKDLKK
jgi:hypothetical protein